MPAILGHSRLEKRMLSAKLQAETLFTGNLGKHARERKRLASTLSADASAPARVRLESEPAPACTGSLRQPSRHMALHAPVNSHSVLPSRRPSSSLRFAKTNQTCRRRVGANGTTCSIKARWCIDIRQANYRGILGITPRLSVMVTPQVWREDGGDSLARRVGKFYRKPSRIDRAECQNS